MIAFDEARAIVADVPALGIERCGLLAAEGRTLAERVVASSDLVPFARSAMDGFAVCASDTHAAPVTLRIGASIYAEASTELRHAPNTATRIATGGVVPDGADAVIPIEDTVASGESIVVVRPLAEGDHVFPPGEDARAGDELVPAGATLDAANLGILASAGITSVAVYRLPRVAIITTGSELVSFDALPARGQIRDSNAITFAATLRSFGVVAIDATTVVDDRAAIRNAIGHALETADLTVISGGASVGERDYVKAVCAELGVTFDFESVALRPARPTGFGRRGAAVVAVLPGNPAAAFVALHQFVRPAVAALSGRAERAMVRISATLDGSLHARPGRALAAFARLRHVSGQFVATPLENQCSALTRLAADADGFVVVPPDSGDVREGDRVDVDVIGWTRVFAGVLQPA